MLNYSLVQPPIPSHVVRPGQQLRGRMYASLTAFSATRIMIQPHYVRLLIYTKQEIIILMEHNGECHQSRGHCHLFAQLLGYNWPFSPLSISYLVDCINITNFTLLSHQPSTTSSTALLQNHSSLQSTIILDSTFSKR